MGKHNTTKKGKQKEPTLAAPASAPVPPPSPPPPPLISSPPAAHHIQYPSATIDTIEEQEFGGLLGGPVESAEEESWQDVDRSANDWTTDPPGNSNPAEGDDWESGIPQLPIPPSPPRKKHDGGRDHTNLHHPQQQFRPPPLNPQNTMGPVGARKNLRAHVESQQSQVAWTRPNDGWEDGSGWDDQVNGDDGWEPSDGWDDVNSGWGQQSHSATWNHAVSAHSAQSQATSHTPGTSAWQSWGEEARRLPKVTFDPAIPPSPSSSGSKPILSRLQQSQTLNALLNNPQQNQQPYPIPSNVGAMVHPVAANNWQQHQSPRHGNRLHQHQHERHQSYEQRHGHENKKNKKGRVEQHVQRAQQQQQQQSKNDKRRQEEHDVWGLGDGWSDLHDEEDQQDVTQDAWGRRVHFSPGALRASMLPPSASSVVPSTIVENITVNSLPQNKLGLSSIPMSKTLSYAYSGTTPSTESEPGRAAMQRITNVQFIESRGEALKNVQSAFYGKQRKAADRFHWLFSPDNDERVSSLLNWINSMSFGIASFGLQKFLQTRERGALVVNAAYRPVHSPDEPAFDWVTWSQIQRTMDRVLQESVGYYNPAVHIIVFVLLPSSSGNSVAIWRRKLSIPSNIRLAYEAQITQAMASLRKEYPVYVDELPPPAKPAPPKKKRKWYKLWLSS